MPSREPLPLPKLKMPNMSSIDEIKDLSIEDFKLGSGMSIILQSKQKMAIEIVSHLVAVSKIM